MRAFPAGAAGVGATTRRPRGRYTRGVKPRTRQPILPLAALTCVIGACARREVAAPPPPPALQAPVQQPAAAPPSASAALPADPAGLSVPAEERALWAIVERLAREPQSQPVLAPGARSVWRGARVSRRPLDAASELAWLVDAEALLLAHGDTREDGDETFARCDAAALSCTVSQPGGETLFRFARRGEGDGARLVLRELASEEP